MFIIFNKQKIYTYCISITAVILLFCIAGTLTDNKESIATAVSSETILPIYNVKTNEKKVALTMNCAWNADDIDKILEILEENNVKITFFMVGDWIEKYPDMVKEIYNNGFEIGIHSMTHPDMRTLSRSEIKQELSENMEMIEELTNYTPKLFRPPYGYYNNDLIEVCEELGLSCIEWSVDSLDWKGLSAGELSGRVIERATNGSIVLFLNNSDNKIEGLKMTLEHFKTQNMSVVPIGELIYYENFTINTQGIQIKN